MLSRLSAAALKNAASAGASRPFVLQSAARSARVSLSVYVLDLVTERSTGTVFFIQRYTFRGIRGEQVCPPFLRITNIVLGLAELSYDSCLRVTFHRGLDSLVHPPIWNPPFPW